MPHTFTVDATADDVDDNIGNSVCHTVANQCTLRAAIQESNDAANPDPDTINFDSSIAGTACQSNATACTIAVSTPLPNAADDVTINGCSSAPNRPQPCVGVDAGGTFTILSVPGATVTIRGLAFTDGGAGLTLGVASSGGSITNNWFGLKVDGTAAGNGVGLFVDGNSNTIGGPGGATGTAPADRNVFAANTAGTSGAGMVIFDGGGQGDNNRIQGNYFGTNPQGTAAVPNSENIEVVGSAGTQTPTGNVIGGTITGNAASTPQCDGECNLISGADGSGGPPGDGIDLGGDFASESPAASTEVQGNFIGTDVTGTADLGNAGSGVRLDNSSFPADGDNNFIGGNAVGDGNLISNSGADAIRIVGDGSDFNVLGRNTGANNGSTANDLFIDLGTNGPGNGASGPNGGTEAPAITSATTGSISGTALPNAAVLVYKTPEPAGAFPGDVTSLVGVVTTDPTTGDWQLPSSSYAIQLAGGNRVTAQQQTGSGSTELSAAAEVPSPPAPPSDTDPPETKIDKGPKKKSHKRKAKFRFSSDEPGTTFQCKLDKKPFKPCASPFKTKVKARKHTFLVEATDAAGNTDASPAKLKFKVLG